MNFSFRLRYPSIYHTWKIASPIFLLTLSFWFFLPGGELTAFYFSTVLASPEFWRFLSQLRATNRMAANRNSENSISITTFVKNIHAASDAHRFTIDHLLLSNRQDKVIFALLRRSMLREYSPFFFNTSSFIVIHLLREIEESTTILYHNYHKSISFPI